MRCHAPSYAATAEIIMIDNYTIVFRSGSDTHFYVVGDAKEVGAKDLVGAMPVVAHLRTRSH